LDRRRAVCGACFLHERRIKSQGIGVFGLSHARHRVQNCAHALRFAQVPEQQKRRQAIMHEQNNKQADPPAAKQARFDRIDLIPLAAAILLALAARAHAQAPQAPCLENAPAACAAAPGR
jgi:hypothetical protein